MICDLLSSWITYNSREYSWHCCKFCHKIRFCKLLIALSHSLLPTPSTFFKAFYRITEKKKTLQRCANCNAFRSKCKSSQSVPFVVFHFIRKFAIKFKLFHMRIISLNLQMSFTYHTNWLSRSDEQLSASKWLGFSDFWIWFSRQLCAGAAISRAMTCIWLNKQQISIRDGFIKNISFHAIRGEIGKFLVNKFILGLIAFTCNISGKHCYSHVNHECQW